MLMISNSKNYSLLEALCIFDVQRLMTAYELAADVE